MKQEEKIYNPWPHANWRHWKDAHGMTSSYVYNTLNGYSYLRDEATMWMGGNTLDAIAQRHQYNGFSLWKKSDGSSVFIPDA